MPDRKQLTAERLRELLHYDPETGVFTWRVDRWAGRPPTNLAAKAGDVAGCLNRSLGYWTISVDSMRHYAHRLAWLYMHGAWPEHQIDHFNRVRADNRLVNLRSVNNSANNQNKVSAQSNSRSGLLGAHPNKPGRTKKWRARIAVGGVQICLGEFDTAAEAHAAYLRAKARLHIRTAAA